MTEAAMGDTVRIHYRGTLEDGSEFDSSAGRDPLEVVLGAGRVISGFEQAVLGMTPGESRTVTIPPEEAYGFHESARVMEVPRDQIPPSVELDVGQMLQATGGGGEAMLLTVVEFDEESVTLDGNHPLAGRDLTFELELVEIV